MPKVRTIFAILMVFTILCSLFVVAFADTSIDAGEIIVTPTIDPYEYGTSPDGSYVFLYHGTAPYLSMEIDTSECVVDRLYVYDAAADLVTEISNQAVTAYTSTKDVLYYVTTAQEIYKTDYIGSSHEFLYQCEQGTVSNLNSYLDVLYFIENGNQIVFLDTAAKEAHVVWACADLDWVFLLSKTKLLAATVAEDHYLYDIVAKTATPVGGMEANDMVTEAVLGATATNEPDASVMSYFSSSSVTQENDISFPLAEYPATLYDNATVNNSVHYRPISWFHVNGAEGCSSSNCKWYAGTRECEGFARYAHDAYVHMVDTSVTYSAWDDNKHLAGEYRFDGNTTAITSFFSTMKTGAYIRYGKTSDSTPENGVHSIVFLSKDSGGIWVYECNQKYYDYLTADQIGSHSESYFGCGVHIQYYTFEQLARQYQYVLHYVNHSFTESPVYENTTYHQKGCANCTGYVRQTHNNVSATMVDRLQHYATFNCCNGGSANTAHTGTTSYSNSSNTHHAVIKSCCSGYVLEEHVFVRNANNRYICRSCGRDRDLWDGIIMRIEDPIVPVAYTE